MKSIIATLTDIVWGPWTVALVLAVGAVFSISAGFPQICRFGVWWRATVGRSLSRKSGSGRRDGISPLQSTLTALAGTLGTGNIVGVATALATGGAGAIFWMWVAGLFGMMTAFAENSLGIIYRRRDSKGGWLGGPMMYMSRGLGAKRTAIIWAAVCAVAAFGVGNMTQINSIAAATESAWNIPRWVTGLVIMAFAAPAIMGGMNGVVRLTARLVPIMAVVYLLGCAAVLVMNSAQIPSALWSIVRSAFTPSAAGGGFLGAMLIGVRRGVFTNEAGLGSAVMVHSAAETDPATQGMWGIFEVFFDTIVMCTITALVILTSGVPYMGATDGAAVSAAAFGGILGKHASTFIALSLVLFAFATIVAWSCNGERAFGYIFGTKWSQGYRAVYCAVIFLGAVTDVGVVWGISDLLNGLMAIPNVICVCMLWSVVRRELDGEEILRRGRVPKMSLRRRPHHSVPSI